MVLKCAKIASISLISVALCEVAFTAWAKWRFGTVDVREIERIQVGNVDAAAVDGEGFAVKALYPHPYLGYVVNSAGRTPDLPLYRRVNNIGLNGREWPLRKDPEKFTILVIGGSVARDIALAGEDVPYLESILNERYEFPRPVQILCGGNSNWFIQQADMLYNLYGEVGDAVVTVSGFNEKQAMMGGVLRLEWPNKSIIQLNPLATRGFEPIGSAWEAQKLKDFSLAHGWRTVYFATWVMRQRLEQSATSQTSDGNNFDTMFALPKEWSREERTEFNLQQYEKYVRQIDVLAAQNGAKSANVIQPVPAIGKTLTDEEKRVAGKLNYVDAYNALAAHMLATDLPLIDLRDVFEDHPETIYCDSVHCVPSEKQAGDNFRRSDGYRLMSERIATELARLWKIPEKHK